MTWPLLYVGNEDNYDDKDDCEDEDGCDDYDFSLHTFSHSAIKIIQWNVIPNKHLAPFSPPTRMYMQEHKRMKYQHDVLFYLNHLLLSKLLWKFLFSLWSAWNGDVMLLHRLSEHRQLPCRRVHVVQRDGKWRKFLLQGANTHPSII